MNGSKIARPWCMLGALHLTLGKRSVVLRVGVMPMSEGGRPDESSIARRREVMIQRWEAVARGKQARRHWWRRLRQLLRRFNPYR